MSGFTHYRIETTEQRGEGFPSQRNLQQQYGNTQMRNDEYRIQVIPPNTEQIVVTDQASFQKIIEAKEREITNLRESVKSLNNQIQDQLKELEIWKNKCRQLQSEKGQSRITMTGQQQNDWELQQLREEVNRLKQENNDYKFKLEKNVSMGQNDLEVNKLKQQIKSLEEQLRSKSYTQITSFNSNNTQEINQLKDQIRALQQENEDLVKAKNLLSQQFQQSQIQWQQSTFRNNQNFDTDQSKLIQNERDDLRRKLKVLEDRIAELQQENQRLNFNCDSYIQEIQQYQLKFNSKTQNTEIEGYLKRISALQHEILVWQDRYKAKEVQELSYAQEQRTVQKDNQILFLQERIKQYEAQMDQLRFELDKYRKDYDGQKGNNYDGRRTDSGEVESLKRKIAEMESDIQILIADLQERDQRISITQNEYEEEIRILKSQSQGQYQNEINKLREEKEKYRLDYERISNDYMNVQRQSEQYKNNSYEVDILKQRIVELQSQIRDTTNQYQSLQSQHSQLQIQFQNQQQSQQSSFQINNLREDYSKLQSQFNLLQQENIQLKQQRQQIDSNSYQFKNMQSDYQALQDRYNQSLNEIQQLNDQLRKYRSDYDSLNQNYIQFQRDSEIKFSQTNNKEIDIMRSKIQQYEQQIQQLRNQQQNQESQLEQQFKERLRVEMYQIEQKLNNQSQMEVQQLQNQYNYLKTQYDQLQNRYQEQTREIMVVKEKSTRESQFESQNLKEQIQQYKQVNMQQNQEIQNLKDQIQKYRIEIEQVGQKNMMIQREKEMNQQNLEEVEKLMARIREQDFITQQKSQQINQLQMDLRNQEIRIKNELEQQFVSRLMIERQNLESKLQTQSSAETQNLQYQLKSLQQELNQYQQRYQQMEQQFNQSKLEINQIRSQQSNVNQDQVKKWQIRITELEHENQTLNIEIERQKNIRKDQENKIQKLIENITELESRMHILEQENARLETKMKKQIIIDKPSDQYIVNQLLGQASSQSKSNLITNTINVQNVQGTGIVTRQSGMNQINQVPSSYNQYYDQQRLQSQNEIRQSQFSQRMQSPQPQVSNYLSPDKKFQPQKMTTTKSVKQAIMSQSNQ
ncbi:unnamed protein product [Paramecium sonneborni]|uniref:Uncharacterized protein n=1 Tax=Paramecium sonneborni TaxID=65129 RepID=A0A8S1MK81_9CILI|nr:unnamed protein product [Paramecium sonneborni]